MLGTAGALGSFLAGSIAVPDLSFVTRDTKVIMQMISLQCLEPVFCTAL